jgi:hypothetical protein
MAVEGEESINCAAQVARRLTITVPAQATTDFTLEVPEGASIEHLRTHTTTAFEAVTDALITVGNVAGGAQYVASTTVKAIGVYNHTLVSAAAADFTSFPAGGLLHVRITQTGGSSAVGAATFFADMILPLVALTP